MLTGDSGGRPWSGRDLPVAPYAGDDGRPDADLDTALGRWSEGAGTEGDVVSAFGAARVFVPIAAVPGASTEMALLTLTGADGRRALAAFTSPGPMAAWRPDARPVPVAGRSVASSAVAEGCDLVALDPAGPRAYTLRRPAVWALAAGESWVPSYADPDVARAVSAACTASGVQSRIEPGEDTELRIVLGLARGLASGEVDAVVTTVLDRLSRDEVVAARVDSIGVELRPV